MNIHWSHQINQIRISFESKCNDPDCIICQKENKIPKKKSETILTILIIETANRFGLTLRASAAVATAILNSFGLVDNNNTKLVIDKNKVQRQVATKRENLRKKEMKNLK